jgi:hypothetical protein
LGDPWVNSAGKVAHPDSPIGAGGLGHFGEVHPIGAEVGTNHALPHPRSPVARYLAHHDIEKKHKPKAKPKAANADDLRAEVKACADKLIGKKVVGDGECYALADQILTQAGGHSADHYTEITDDADYVWGTALSDLRSVEPGDVLQFRDHEIDIETITTTKTTYADGNWTEKTDNKIETHKRGHHTAIVSAKNSDGTLSVVEQHVVDPNTRKLSHVVRQNRLILSGGVDKKPTTIKMHGKVRIEQTITITTTVSGTIMAFHPELKS